MKLRYNATGPGHVREQLVRTKIGFVECIEGEIISVGGEPVDFLDDVAKQLLATPRRGACKKPPFERVDEKKVVDKGVENGG